MNFKKVENWLKLNGVLPQDILTVSSKIKLVEETLNGYEHNNSFVTAVVNKDWTSAKKSADNTNINYLQLYKKYMVERVKLLTEQTQISKTDEMSKLRSLVNNRIKFTIKENHLIKENQNNEKKPITEGLRNIGGIATMSGTFMGGRTNNSFGQPIQEDSTDNSKDMYYIGECVVVIEGDVFSAESKHGITKEFSKSDIEGLLQFLSENN